MTLWSLPSVAQNKSPADLLNKRLNAGRRRTRSSVGLKWLGGPTEPRKGRWHDVEQRGVRKPQERRSWRACNAAPALGRSETST